MGTVEMIFEVGEDVAAAAADLPKTLWTSSVDIVCESSEFSVDRRWMKSERNTPQLAASCASLDSHNSPLRRIPGMPHTTNQLQWLSTNPQRSSQQQALLVSKSELKDDK